VRDGRSLISPAALWCLGFPGGVGPRAHAARQRHGQEVTATPREDPFVAESAVADPARRARRARSARPLDLLLTPHLRVRLRSLELLGPILEDRLSENEIP
jgi:hypothetical protein